MMAINGAYVRPGGNRHDRPAKRQKFGSQRPIRPVWRCVVWMI